MDTAQRMRAIDKKARRKMNNKARREGLGIEGVITTVTTQLRQVVDREVQTSQLYNAAKRDMGIRTRLTIEGKTNSGAAKRRRQLNDWELNTKPQGAGDGWLPNTTRRAVGKCDAERVEKRNKAKRGY